MANLMDLPVELRECIYEQYLATLRPTTFKLYKKTLKPCWIIVRKKELLTPPLLLLSRTISTEFQKVMSRMLSSSPDNALPLSWGPTIEINFSRKAETYGNIHYDPRKLREDDDIPKILVPILMESARSIVLRLVMPQAPSLEATFISMLRFISAVCRARDEPLKHVIAIRDPLSTPGWRVDINAIAAELNKINCEVLNRQNWYQPWFGPKVENVARNGVGNDVVPGGEHLNIDEAWRKVGESIQQYEDQYGTWLK